MEQPGQYSRHSGQLFQSSQILPPPQLHLPPPSSFSRSNTLPPIPNIPNTSNTSNNSHQNHRFPPVGSSYSSSSGSIHSSVLPPLPSPSSSSSHSWPPLHRTSNSRDELHPSQQQHQHQQDQRHGRGERDERPIKRESASSQSVMHHHEPQPPPPPPQHQQQHHQPVKESGEDGMPSTSDFVKKLYKMLEDPSFTHVVCWGPQGDCFVVKDMNEFTKSILPRMFKHSNFASFVRQLNKYDFHKVKNTDDNQFGEHSWTFRHPDFHAHRRDALENIKRKVPTQRKSTLTSSSSSSRNAVPTSPGPNYPSASSAAVDALQAQVERLTQSQEDMAAHVRSLERNYQDVLVEMVNFQRNMAQQDSLMQNLISYFLQVENGKAKEENMPGGPSNTQGSDHNPFLPTQEAQRMMGSYPETDVARASLVQMNEISRRAEVAGMSFRSGGAGSTNGTSNVASGSGTERPPSAASRIFAAAAGLMTSGAGGEEKVMSRQDALARIEELQRSRPTSAQGGGVAGFGGGGVVNGDEPFRMNGDVAAEGEGGSGNTGAGGASNEMQLWPSGADVPAVSAHQGLQVYTLGHLMPRSNVDDPNGNWSFDPTSLDSALPAMIGDGTSDVQQQSQPPPPQATPQDEAVGFGNLNGGAGPSSAPSAGPTFNGESSAASTSQPSSRASVSQKLRVRRSTFVPGWAVPPRVLLVDDDAVNRKLSSKFLQVFGCTTDVAVDGQVAVDKMNLEKYDLVLMDIVMPKLDGVTATSLIRQFDPMTPIISMTSNSKPNEIMTYYSSGMNDILPKPFTKEGLLEMLEKHLMHLKVIQQMSKVPRSVGIPPLSDGPFEQALTVQAAAFNPSPTPMEDDGRINPLAGMGLTDEQYSLILQNLVNGQSFPGVGLGSDVMGVSVVEAGGGKRALDDDSDGRDGKRSRFEVLE